MEMGCADLCFKGWSGDMVASGGGGVGVGDIGYMGVKDERSCTGFLVFFRLVCLRDLSSHHLFGNEYFSKKHIIEHYMGYANIFDAKLFNQ